MIITRSPLRITLGGGGTDLPSYYREHGGFLIAATIDKYVYVTVIRPFKPGIFLKYSKQLTNMTPAHYLNYCRVEAAAEMLGADLSKSVTEVALACGFSSSQYFASVFRRHYGCTPNAYRQQATI